MITQNNTEGAARPSLILSIPAAEIGQAPRVASPRCRAPHPGKTKKPADGTLAIGFRCCCLF